MIKRKFKFVAEASFHRSTSYTAEYDAKELEGMTDEEIEEMVRVDYEDWFNDQCYGSFAEVEE